MRRRDYHPNCLVWSGTPGLIEISPGASSFQTSELTETGKLQAPAVILPFLSKITVIYTASPVSDFCWQHSLLLVNEIARSHY